MVNIQMTPFSFKPAWWLPGPHLQTIWAARHYPKIDYVLRRERLELADGDFLDLDYLDQLKAPRVLLIHGLNGGLNAPYIERMLQAIKNQGWGAIVMHLRGCSGEANRLARSYHAGETADVQIVIQKLQQDAQTPLAVIGYSLGGNILLKYLGDTEIKNFLTAAIAISVPFELKKAALSLNKGGAKFYQWWLLNDLRKFVRHKFKKTLPPFDLNLIKKLKNFYDFDHHVTAPLNGFENAEDYYAQSSCRQFLKNIQTSTLIIHAKDDPFMSEDVIPMQQELSNAIRFELLSSGGHVGFVGGDKIFRPEYWLEVRVIEFLKESFGA